MSWIYIFAIEHYYTGVNYICLFFLFTENKLHIVPLKKVMKAIFE